MDLMNFIPTTDTVDVVITNPKTFEPLKNEDGSEMTITAYLPHSKEYKDAVHVQTNIRLKQMQAKGKKSNAITAEELEVASIKMLAKTTKSWNITLGGEKPEFTEDAAKKLYQDIDWIKALVEDGVAEAEVFTQD